MDGTEPVEFTPQEREVLRSLVRQMGQPAPAVTSHATWEEDVSAVARKEIASLAGLVLRRLQEDHPTRSFERNAMEDVLDARLSEIFGEVLADFGGRTGGGEEPGA